MLVMILERTPRSLRGELSRWLMEPKPGVFLGNVSARVKDELWEMAAKKRKGGAVMQVWSDRSPQGYSCRVDGDASRRLVEFEGITLPVMPAKPQEKEAPTSGKQRAT